MEINYPDQESGGDRDFSTIPEGKYLATIFDIELKETLKKDKKFLDVTFRIDEEGEYNGRKVWGKYFLTDNCTWKLQQLHASVGINVKGRGKRFDASVLQGKQVAALVTHNEFNGKTRAEVDRTYALEGVTMGSGGGEEDYDFSN